MITVTTRRSRETCSCCAAIYGGNTRASRSSIRSTSCGLRPKLPGLLTGSERSALLGTILAKQQPDGGWSLTDLGTWKRQDHTPLETRSDGYATGLTMVALEQAGLAQNLPQAKRGLAWLAQNQNSDDGKWPAWSVNLKRDPASDIGRFMSDAATGFAVLALENSH
jgi:squalene-hopene/tetraprenyl-beta-curcumene cyclase